MVDPPRNFGRGIARLSRQRLNLARDDGELIVDRGDVRNYNYQNFMENFVDLGHVYVLHLIAPGEVPDEVKPHCDMTVDTDWRRSEHRVFETHFGMKSVIVHNTADPKRKFANTWSLVMPAATSSFIFGSSIS